MLRPLLRLSLLAILVLTPASHAAVSDDEAEIATIERAMAAADNTDAYTASWNRDAVLDDMLTMTPHHSHYAGLAEIHRDLDPQFEAYNFTVQILHMTVTSGPRIGFAYCTLHAVGHPKSPNGGPPVDMVFRETDGFEKAAGKWQLFHQVLSVPFDHESGAAIFDSK